MDTRIARPFVGLLALAVLGCEDPLANGPVPLGIWGGEGIHLEVTPTGAEAEFDCAAGTIDMPLNAVNGRFDAEGTFTLGHGGPIVEDEVPDTRPARYIGHLSGRTLQLEVRFEGLIAGDPPTFVLKRGDPGVLRRCL